MPQNRAIGKTLLLGLLWGLSLAALCVNLTGTAAPAEGTVAWSRTLPATEAWFLAALALGLGYWVMDRLYRPFAAPRLWVVAVLAAAVATLGESFAQTGTAELALSQMPLTLLYFAGRVPTFYMGMALLLYALSRAPAAREPDAGAAREPYATAKPVEAGAGAVLARPAATPGTWVFMLVLLVCWLPYLFALWPGTVSNDSITQLGEIFGRKPLSNGNPVFQTGLVWLAVSVGKGLFHSADAAVALYACTQAVMMAWLLGYTLRRVAEMRAPGWLLGLATAFYALCPVFPLFAFCMGKDTTFAMAVLWFTLMVWRVVASKWPPMRTVVGLCLSAALCALLRNAGVALAGITLLWLLIWAFTKGTRQWRAPLAALAVVAACMLTLWAGVLPRLAAAPMPETENWSVPLQQVARVVASETLTAEEQAAIDAVMPLADIQPAYNGELSDPVKALWRERVTAEQKAAFFATWLRLGLKYPATYASATFHNGYGYLLPGYVSTIKPTFLLGMEGRTTLIDGAFDFTVNPRANALKATLQTLFAFAPFRLISAPGLYGLLTVFALAAMMSLKRRAKAICMLPALFTLVGCLFSAVNGYYRYAMPLYFVTPVLLALVAQASRAGLRMRDATARQDYAAAPRHDGEPAVPQHNATPHYNGDPAVPQHNSAAPRYDGTPSHRQDYAAPDVARPPQAMPAGQATKPVQTMRGPQTGSSRKSG